MPMHRANRFAFRISAMAIAVSTALAATALQGARAGAQSSSQQTEAGATIDESRLKRRTEPIGCGTKERVELDGVLLEADRVAIEALGECRVTVKNSRIVARTAVMAGGKASLTFENSIIEGTLRVTQESVASVRSSTIRGRTQKLQAGKIMDLGQNVWQ
jgi:hypothetical protein